VNAVSGIRFDVMLVPYTLDETTFGEMANGTRVNLEVDVLAKYVASLSGKPGVDAPDT
jgi:riboflavin synthase